MTNQLVNLVEMAIVFSIHVTDLRFYLLTNAHEGNDGTETTEETLPTHASTQRKPSKLWMNTFRKTAKNKANFEKCAGFIAHFRTP